MPAGPFTLTEGPAAGQTIQYFRTPWGGYIEFISYPDGMGDEGPGVRRLWSPKLNHGDAVTKVPGLLGIDHVGLTVPNISVAARWLEDNLADNGKPTARRGCGGGQQELEHAAGGLG